MVPVTWLAGLVFVASLANWLRKRSWAERMRGPGIYAAIGAGAGAIALVLAIVFVTPLIERMSDQAVQWSMYPIVRGSGTAFITVALIVAVGCLASELVFRAFVVELGHEFTRNYAVAIMVAALAEALLADGDAAVRLGAGVFSAGLGWMYVASGRSILAPLCARLVFSLGALVLEALRVVG
jgi:membrane protease YdiL (CAAX protease family)